MGNDQNTAAPSPASVPLQAAPVDYDALAKQSGAISSQPASSVSPGIDYDALAKQAGAISSQSPAKESDEGVLHRAFLGANTAAGTPTPSQIQNETSGLSDILQGNIREGLSKVWDSEQPHVIPGSPIERAIQTVSPGFHGAGGPAPERALAHPIVDAAQFIDKKEHPMAKAVAEAAQSMTSPDAVAVMAATGGLGMVESPQALGVANRLLSAGFAASTVANAYQHLTKFKEAYDKGDKDEAEYQLTHAVLSGTISALAAGHAATGEQLPFASENEKAVGQAVASVPGKVAEGIKDTAGKIKERVYPTLPKAPEEIPFGKSEPILPKPPEEIKFGKTEPILPEKPAPIAATPRPAVPHVEVETPFDDVTIRKLGGGNLSAEARDTLRQHVGDTFEPGSSDELHLLKAVKPVNDKIAELGGQLNEILDKAPDFKQSPLKEVEARLQALDLDIPGGLEEQLGKGIQKEYGRFKERLNSTNPREINETIRDLDSRVQSYNSPEDITNANTPGEAADAARVVMRRALRDKLNTEIPETKPFNAELSPNLEVRSFLQKKFKNVATDSAGADAQYTSELQKGKQQIANKAAQAAQDEQFRAATDRAKAEHAGAQDIAQRDVDQQNQAAKEAYQKEVDRIKAEHGGGQDLAKSQIDKANETNQTQYKEGLKKAESVRGAMKTIGRTVAGAAIGGLLGGPLGSILGAVVVNGRTILKNTSQNQPLSPGFSHIRDSKGIEYVLPSKNLDAAKEHDPGLEVIKTA